MTSKISLIPNQDEKTLPTTNLITVNGAVSIM